MRTLYTNQAFLDHFEPSLVWGRLLMEKDRHTDRLLLGTGLAADLNFREQEPYVKVGGTWFQVTGTVAGLRVGGGQIHQFLDISQALVGVHETDRLLTEGRPLRFALVRTGDADEIPDLQLSFTRFLDQEKLSGLKLDLRLPLKQRELARRSRNLLLGHGPLISVLCLGLSCLGILVSYHLQLNYRREEFGTLVALGASRAYIGRMLLAEVLVLTGGSGVLGLLLGVGVGQACSLAGLPMLFHPYDLAWDLTILGLVSLLTGSVPALAALRLDPIELLRLNR